MRDFAGLVLGIAARGGRFRADGLGARRGLRRFLHVIRLEQYGGVIVENGRELGIVLVTHYRRILDELTPDVIHVLFRGRIVETGGPELAGRLDVEGYESWRS